MTGNDSKLSTLHRESTRAFYKAEGGVDKALWYLNTPTDQGGYGIGWRTTSSLIYPSSTASEYYELTVLTTTEPGPGVGEIITIHSEGIVAGEGKYDKGTRKIEVKLEKGIAPSPGAVYNYALMTFDEDSNLVLNGHIAIEGDIHSNGDITGNGFDPDADLDGGITYAGDDTTIEGDNVEQTGFEAYPSIDWDYYYDNAAEVYDTDTAYEIGNETLTGIHYFKGDVIIKNDLLVVGTIVVEGDITISGNPDVTLLASEEISLVMISSGKVTFNGNVHVEGIIHTEGEVELNGTTNIDEGAILAEDGVVNGTGSDTKIVYDVENQDHPVPGTGIEVWKKVAWQEVS